MARGYEFRKASVEELGTYMKPWTPKSNYRAWSSIHKQNVDVLRVYKRTATIRVCMGGLRNGEMLTIRGERIDTLSKPKPGNGPVMEPCPECDGTGEVPMTCSECYQELTSDHVDSDDSGLCPECLEKENEYEAAASLDG